MDVKRFGDHACIISFDEQVSKHTHQQVMSAYSFFKTAEIEGITDLIPSYCALTILFDPSIIHFQQLGEAISQINFEKTDQVGRLFRMPVCYEFAQDQQTFCDTTGLSWREVIDLHISTDYLVYMMGFLPGFLYMGEVNQQIQVPRKKVPRKKVEAGSVGIAGAQTGVYPIASPGGWNILGRTPVSLFNPSAERTFPVEVGDVITFYSISKKEFQSISKDKNHRMEEVNGR